MLDTMDGHVQAHRYVLAAVDLCFWSRLAVGT